VAFHPPPVSPAPDGRDPAGAAVAIRIRGLTKCYGDLLAVDGVDLEVGAGELFGLIGPDGAGKTSTFHILGGVMAASDGSVEILGGPARDARDHVGYLTQAFSLYTDLSVDENLRYVGALRRVPPAVIETRGGRYLTLFGLGPFRQRLAGRLSGGMKQKLALACALVAEPEVLLLDEPTTGVDPVSRREFWDALVQLSAKGMTIVVATPYLDEAERCHRVALMHAGRLLDVGTPAALRQRLGLDRLEVRSPDLRHAEEVLVTTTGLSDVQRFGDRLDVMTPDAEDGEGRIRAALRSADVPLTGLTRMAPTLENTFVALLRSLGDEPAASPLPGGPRTAADGATVAIGARRLAKHYGEFTAVNDVSLAVRYGEIYGLLGANGAGKTTTIKMLCGLVEPSAGETELAGMRGSLRTRAVRQQVGYMSQKFSLYDDLTIDENLDFFAGVYGVPPAERPDRTRWVLAFAGLEGRGHQLTGRLPGGWKQRVAFGAAVMHRPRVLFLDEPTSGVDPLARRAFWHTINDLADQGTAILVTTHYLEEAEQCNRLGLMVAGQLVAEGTPSGLKAQQGGRVLELTVDQPQRALDVLRDGMPRWRVSLFGDRLHVIVDDDPAAAESRLRERLGRQGIRVLEVSAQEYSLEDVFLVVVERARQELGAVAA
jgi:ABC-2 type transport system ATP-binding protein